MTIPDHQPVAAPADFVQVTGQPEKATTLPLGQPAATGYEWSLEAPPEVQRLPDQQSTKSGDTLGDPPGGAVRIRAPRGKYRIVATLARPWERARPVQTVVIELVVE